MRLVPPWWPGPRRGVQYAPYAALSYCNGSRFSTPDSVGYRGNTASKNPGAGAITCDDAGDEWALNHAVIRTAGLATRLHGAAAGDAWAIVRAEPRAMILDAVRYEQGWSMIGDGSPSREAIAPVDVTDSDKVH